MALQYQFGLLSNGTIFKHKMLPSKPISPLSTITTCRVPRTIQCVATTLVVSDQNTTFRRCVNSFKPSIWDYDYIQSLRSDFVEESYAKERDRLKEEVRDMFSKFADLVDQLEFIDVLQRLGVAAHFNLEIRNIMENTYNNYNNNGILKRRPNSLYATALEFRLLRHHGYNVSSDLFNGFLDSENHFDSRLSVDIRGLLSLYEASFLSTEGEMILDEARDFSSTCLKKFLRKNKDENDEIFILVNHSLELPLYWRTSRLEARWFIDVYQQRRQNVSPSLLKLAKLDFNVVQVQHQEDLKHTSRWWKGIGLGEKLNFAIRDRIVENFFWTVGLAFQPQLGHFRRLMAKVNALITTIDDIYDAFGKFEELQLFTEVVDRWDVNAMDELPGYVKICFLALYNFVNEVAFDFLKDHGQNIIHHLKKAWADLCKSYMIEAKWYYYDYQPTLQEYLENAWISISAPVILVHAYFALPTSNINDENFVRLEDYYELIHSSATILRLANDMGTSKREKETGDIPKSIECYMKETGASESDAHRHIKSLVFEAWKKINTETANSFYSKSFIQISENLARMSLYMYQHGDGHTVQDSQTMNHILFQPIVGI
ncbi:terpene synthase 10-like [Neltuma alba]|uniref:terpene synthase 10-like n=1 Tax=Neltuma alba TaxID=207710 RepID=UPI0010A58517|nr:terpene synthase 10-like [Prosopis alba]